MAYTPTEWKKGDIVSSAKLNKLEQGVANAGGVTIVHAELSASTPTLDMTAGAIMAAAQTGLVILQESYTGYGIVGVGPLAIANNNGYYVKSIAAEKTYGAPTADAYPSILSDGGDDGGRA